MSYFNTVNIQDSNNTTVNPATSDKQDTINTTLSSIETKQTNGSQKAQLVNSSGQVADISSDGKLKVEMVVGVPRANQSKPNYFSPISINFQCR